jgi:hypothetical protein
MNILLVGGTGSGKSEMINRSFQAITGLNTSIAATGVSTGTLTKHLLCYRISPSLNLFDYRGFHYQGVDAEADFGAYRQALLFILQGQGASYKYVNGVLTPGEVHASNRIHGVIFVQTLEDHDVVNGSSEKRELLMLMLAGLGIPHVIVKTRVDQYSIDRLPRVNLAATPEDGMRVSSSPTSSTIIRSLLHSMSTLSVRPRISSTDAWCCEHFEPSCSMSKLFAACESEKSRPSLQVFSLFCCDFFFSMFGSCLLVFTTMNPDQSAASQQSVRPSKLTLFGEVVESMSN